MIDPPETEKINTESKSTNELVDPMIPRIQLEFEDKFMVVNGELKRLEKIMDFYDDPPETAMTTQITPSQSMGIAENFNNYLLSASEKAQNTMIANTNESGVLASVPFEKAQESFCMNTGMYLQNTPCNTEMTSVTMNISDNDRITSVMTREKLKKRAIVFVYNHNLYVFNGYCYEMLPCDDALLFIATHCKDDIDNVGNARHASAVYEALLLDSDINLPKEKMNHSTITFDNGYLELTNFTLHRHSTQNYSDFRLHCSYLSYVSFNACPVFNRFLNQLTGGDGILIQRIWEMIGYCLTPDIEGKVIFVLQGVPNSGKSLLTRFLTKLFPENHVTSLDIHELDRSFTASELINKYICIFPDMPSKVLGSTPISKLKQFSGNDKVSADVKYKNRAKFTNHAKLICATNHPFRISEHDEALEERLVAIPFNYSISKEEQNPNLIYQLWDERDAIVSIALSYYRQLVVNHYRFSGNYSLNSIVSRIAEENPVYVQEDIAAFLEKFYCYYKDVCIPGNELEDERNNRNRSFIDDMHRLFISIYYDINKNTFSSLCTRFFANNPYVTKSKHRRTSTELPQNVRTAQKSIRKVEKEY